MNMSISSKMKTFFSSYPPDIVAPVVNLKEGVINPFLPADLPEYLANPQADNPMTNLFCRPGLQMTVDIPDINATSQIRNALDLSSVILNTTNTASQVFTPFNLRGSIDVFNNETEKTKPYSLGQFAKFSMEYARCNGQFELIGAIIFTAFIYSHDTKQIITNPWVFAPEGSVNFLKAHSIPYNFSTSSCFQIDPMLLDQNLYLVILLSHPTTVDNSADILKYYATPNLQTKQIAQNNLKVTFPRVKNAYSQFGFGYIELSSIIKSEEHFEVNQFFFTENNNIIADNLFDKINDSKAGKLKQLGINLVLNKIDASSNLINSIRFLKPQPFLAPNHQVYVSLRSAAIKSPRDVNARNILIKLSICDNENSTDLPLVHNPFNQGTLDTYAYSHCIYHEKEPHYLDDFVFELPFPIQDTVFLRFEVVHVHAKISDRPETKIGIGHFQLIENGVIKTGDNLLVPIKNYNENEASSKVFISVISRSCYQSDDINVKKLIEEKDLDTYLPRLQKEHIFTNLTTILTIFIERLKRDEKDANIDHLVLIQKAAEKLGMTESFMKYLATWTQIFALRNMKAIRGMRTEQQISLNEQRQVKDVDVVLSMPAPMSDPFMSDPTLLFPPMPMSTSASNQFEPQQPLDMKTVHTKLMKAMVDYLRDTGNELRDICMFIDFILSAIIKSMATTEVVNFAFFNEMCEALSYACVKVSGQGWIPCLSYSIFCHSLFDLEFHEESSNATSTIMRALINNGNFNSALVPFIDLTFQPAFLYMLLTTSDKFSSAVITLLKSLTSRRDDKKSKTKNITRALHRCYQVYNQSHAREVADCLVPALLDINVNQLPPLNEAFSLLSLFIFIMKNMTRNSLEKTIPDQNSSQKSDIDNLLKDPKQNERPLYSSKISAMFEIAHYLLTNLTEKVFAKYRRANDTNEVSIALLMPSPTKRPVSGTIKPKANMMLALEEAVKAQAFEDPLSEIHAGIFSFIRTAIMCTPANKQDELMNVFYHAALSKISYDNFVALCGMVPWIFKGHSPKIFCCTTPPLAKMLYKMLSISYNQYKKPNVVYGLFTSLFENDYRTTGNNNRSVVIAMRAISLMSHEEIVCEDYYTFFNEFTREENKALQMFAYTFMRIRENSLALLEPNIHIDKLPELLLKRVLHFRTCPDQMLAILDELLDYHQKNDFKMEYVSTMIFKLAIILEYGVFLEQIPNLYGVQHCASQFVKNCPLAQEIFCGEAFIRDTPLVPGFCSSPMFSQTGLLGCMIQLFDFGLKNQIFDGSTFLYDVSMPLLEFSRLYGVCNQFLGIISSLFKSESNAPSSTSDVMQDRYFRVILVGKIFGAEDGKGYVYHANRLTRVFDISKQIVAAYNNIYPNKIELLQATSGRLDPEKGYVNVTFVEPYHEDEEELSIGQVDLSDQFYFDTPFVPGSNKAQGTIETQWIRRTVISTVLKMPCPLRRVEINPAKGKEIEYEPIRVAYRQIRNRTKSIISAINEADYQTIQQLLHGSLLAQVNEGPAKIAEVFLTGHSPLRPKLKKEFQRFLEANERGVKKHAEWVADNQAFLALQVQLEAGMDALREKLTPLLDAV